MGVIYTLTNVVTGKKYVGKTMVGANPERKKAYSERAKGGAQNRRMVDRGVA